MNNITKKQRSWIKDIESRTGIICTAKNKFDSAKFIETFKNCTITAKQRQQISFIHQNITHLDEHFTVINGTFEQAQDFIDLYLDEAVEEEIFGEVFGIGQD